MRINILSIQISNESYYEKYMQARKDAGITEDIKEAQDNFIKFLVEDVDLGF